jgi:molybdenum cofactor biosynthesis protein B
MGYTEHSKEVPEITYAIFVVSDSRNEKNDKSGKRAEEIIGNVSELKFVKNDKQELEKAVKESKADVIITIGGTGVSKRDISVETLREISRKELPGFGELFRRLSAKEISSGAILSRAFCGIVDNKVVFCLPGSTQAVELAIKDIILNEAPHIVKHVKA